MKEIEIFDIEFNSLILELELEKQIRILNLKNKHIDKLDIKVGDIIYDVTGIIKVGDIDFHVGYNGRGGSWPTFVEYIGLKYKWVKGGFVTKSKHNQIGELYSYSDLKKIDSNKIIHE